MCVPPYQAAHMDLGDKMERFTHHSSSTDLKHFTYVHFSGTNMHAADYVISEADTQIQHHVVLYACHPDYLLALVHFWSIFIL